MNIDLKPKLIAIANLNKLRLFKAEGIKITTKLEEVPLEIHKEFSHERGTYQKTSHPASSYDPHTSEADYQYNETAQIISKNISEELNEHNYGELMLAAPSKLLGHIRQHLNNKTKSMLSKELPKDLAHKSKAEIEEIFFS